MNNKVVNKQIPLRSIIDVANYLEDYKEKWDKMFQQENEKNKNKPYAEKKYEYENAYTNLKYTIEFHNGKNITESDYNWFVGNLNKPRTIKSIELNMSISYYARSQNSNYNDIYKGINIMLFFRDCGGDLKYSDVIINVDTTNQENEAHNLYSEVMNILEDNEDRYNKTIKHRKIRTQCFTISVGIILSYILYIILKINEDVISPVFAEYLSNTYILVFGQWFVAILFGNLFSYWYILSLYMPLLPQTRYAGFNKSTYKSKYTDDINEYIEHSEVHFGKFWDAEKRRTKIEKIYKVTKIILLVQLVISVILFLILK